MLAVGAPQKPTGSTGTLATVSASGPAQFRFNSPGASWHGEVRIVSPDLCLRVAARRLGGKLAPLRKQEPRLRRLHALEVEVNHAQLEDFQHRLDGRGNVAHGAPRWTELARRALLRADQAQPTSARGEQRGHTRGESFALGRLVEDVPAAAIEHDVDGPAGCSRGE